MTILQRKSVQFIGGWSCSVVVSRFTDYCGSFGHSKHLVAPAIEVNHPVTVTQCWDIINTESYTTPDNIPRPIKLEAENIIAIYKLGVINVGDNSVTYHGQIKCVKDNVIKDVLQIAQFKIRTQRERYKAKDG